MTSLGDPALLPPAPRRIRRRRGYFQLALNHLQFVFLLMFAYVFWHIGIGVVKILWFSTSVPANITKVLVTPGKDGASYELLLAYHFGEAAYSQKLSIGPHEAELLKEGDTVQLQVLPERPDRPQLYHENYPTAFVTMLICLFTLGPTAGIGTMLWRLYVAPWNLRALIRHGAATSATIVDKKEVSGRPPTYTIAYEYRAPPESVAGRYISTPVTVKASMKVPLEDYQEAQVGDQVIVLYRPERPRRSVIYRYADYEFISAPFETSVRQSPATENPLTWYWVPVGVVAAALFAGIAWLLGWW